MAPYQLNLLRVKQTRKFSPQTFGLYLPPTHTPPLCHPSPATTCTVVRKPSDSAFLNAFWLECDFLKSVPFESQSEKLDKFCLTISHSPHRLFLARASR
jgi:hypothetical protein